MTVTREQAWEVVMRQIEVLLAKALTSTDSANPDKMHASNILSERPLMTQEFDALQARMRGIVEQVAERRKAATAKQAQDAAVREAAEAHLRRAHAAADRLDDNLKVAIDAINHEIKGSGLALGHQRQDNPGASVIAAFSVGAFLDSRDLANRMSFDIDIDGLVRARPAPGQTGRLQEFKSAEFGVAQIQDILLGFVERQIPGLFGETT